MSEHDDRPTDTEGKPEESPALPAWVADALAQPAVWAEPPAGLEESVVATIVTERDTAPARAPDRTAVRRRSRMSVTWQLMAVAAAVIVIALGVVLMTGDDAGEEEIALPIAGTELAPNASAQAIVDELAAGVAIRLQVQGLAPAPPGSYYQGWVRSDDGESVSVGTFHLRGGGALVTLWSGVDIDEYQTLTVTLQREGEGAESSGEVVLRGSLRP
jgi:Anti-sigma-K factor rskA